jgi:CheY-like chemotaxis protein
LRSVWVAPASGGQWPVFIFLPCVILATLLHVMKDRGVGGSPIFPGAVVGGSIFVLFVDDDVAFADAAARSLEAVGMRTAVALGSTALDEFDSSAVDVVVTDIKLRGGAAHSLALERMIRNKSPRVPIILMTTYPEFIEGEVALPGAVLYKPGELAELCRKIKARLAQ